MLRRSSPEALLLPVPISFFANSLLAAMIFGVCVLPAGYLAAAAGNAANFRDRSPAERLLWSLALGFPFSTLLAVGLGALAPWWLMQSAFLALALVAALRILTRLWRRPTHHSPLHQAVNNDRLPLPLYLSSVPLYLSPVLIAAACCVFCLLATVPLLWHGHRLEPVLSNDWYIRLPLLYAAAHSGIPPINPLFTLRGTNPALHYYYFFYVLSALPMRVLPMTAAAALTAGVLWSTLTFFAVCLLLLRHLTLPSSLTFATLRWRSLALLFVPVSLITGLDVLPTLLTPALGGHLLPTIYWWNINDGVNTWPGLVGAAPHHLAGLSMALLAYLLLTLPAETLYQRWRNALFGCLALAAAIGTSTFMAGGVIFAIVLLATDRLYRRHFAAAAAALTATALALLLDARYLATTLHGSAAIAGRTVATGHLHLPIAFVLRNWHHAYGLTGDFFAHVLHRVQPHGLLAYLEALPALALSYAVDLGFFAWILYALFRHSRRTPSSIMATDSARALGCLLVAFATISTFVSSAPMQSGLNDLGRHNLFALRTLLALLACPLVALEYRTWRAPQNRREQPNRWRLRFTLPVALALLGLAGTLYDVAVQRVYLPLLDAGLIRPVDPFLFAPGLGLRYQQLAEAWSAIGHDTPPNAVVQGNPNGPLQRPFLLYLNRRVAAGDLSCESGFGGDPALCYTTIVRPLLALYAKPDITSALPSPPQSSLPAATSTTAFAALCAQLQLTALVATDDDPVWYDSTSWVWHTPTLYAGPTVRVSVCPTPSPHTASQGPTP